MNTTGNTILITGGGSGIGRGLAEAFHQLGNQVIIAGRRQRPLDEVTAANPGMHSAQLDIGDAASIASFAEQIKRDHPTLNVVIHNAGIMRTEQVTAGSVADAEATVATNLLGPIRLTAALLPFLLEQSNPQRPPVLMTVSSGLAFLPLTLNPTYCATKAAIHSYTQSLRYQLRNTAVQVLELIPPYVQTELQGTFQATDPHAMPLNEFITEVMHILATSPAAVEICVGRVKQLRSAEASGNYDTLFRNLNDAMAAHAASKPAAV